MSLPYRPMTLPYRPIPALSMPRTCLPFHPTLPSTNLPVLSSPVQTFSTALRAQYGMCTELQVRRYQVKAVRALLLEMLEELDKNEVLLRNVVQRWQNLERDHRNGVER